MKALWFWVAIILPALTGCQTFTDQEMQVSKDGVRTELVKRLIKSLASEPVFKEYDAAMNEMVAVSVSVSQSNQSRKFDRTILREGFMNLKTSGDYLAHLEKAGIYNPERQLNAMKRLGKAKYELYSKYPELKTFNKKEMILLVSTIGTDKREVFVKARNQVSKQ
ncbi:hypothetical protein [Spirosoma sp.]|uniref:hypothetical protein n=1 Tax=Spirosoma sp. TaxID=1899569 RepID=UPI003B3AC03F